MTTYKKATCPICGGSVLAVNGAVYDKDACRKRAKRLRYRKNRQDRGLRGTPLSPAQAARNEAYRKAKFGDDYREGQ